MKRRSYKTKTLENGYEVWSRISSDEKVTKEHIGKRAWVAGEFKTKKFYIADVHKKGEPGWPDGGVTIKGGPFDRHYYINKVRLHPEEFKRKRNASSRADKRGI
jgi:hypothetical protein